MTFPSSHSLYPSLLAFSVSRVSNLLIYPQIVYLLKLCDLPMLLSENISFD
jgi:hypothetical protein